MKLEDVTMEIRPRTDWEAVDSGFAMVRRDFWRCWSLWWIALIPVWLLFYPMRHTPWLWLSVMMWSKWIGCRMVLHQLSRRLFGENPTWRSLLHEIPHAWKRRFFYRMILARFSPWKPLSTAVEELEGLRGERFRMRMSMITRKGEGAAVLLTFVSCVATLWTSIALFFIGLLFFPESAQERWWASFDEVFFEEDPGFFRLVLVCITVASSLVDGFMTGAGFGLYVNSRTWIEGWDVELAFKRIANRLRQQVLLWMGVIVFVGATMVHGADLNNSTNPRSTIEEIKTHEDFVIHKEKYRVPKSSVHGAPLSPPASLAGLFQVLGYVILGVFGLVLVVFLLWLLFRARWLRQRLPVQNGRIEKARVVMGMEVSAASLPSDLLASADALWRNGERQQAMGLLYRGSLAWWIEQAEVGICESDTEGDCLARVEKIHHVHESYFQMLTQAWLLVAYARHIPPQEFWQELCRKWPFAERRSA